MFNHILFAQNVNAIFTLQLQPCPTKSRQNFMKTVRLNIICLTPWQTWQCYHLVAGSTVARATQKSRSMGSITLTIVFFCSSYYSSQFLVFVVQSLHANVRDFLPQPLLPAPFATALLLRLCTTPQNSVLSRSWLVKLLKVCSFFEKVLMRLSQAATHFVLNPI